MFNILFLKLVQETKEGWSTNNCFTSLYKGLSHIESKNEKRVVSVSERVIIRLTK